jgi:hypothetical protein
MVGYLEDYVGAVEKIHGRHAKEYEKVLKVSLILANSCFCVKRLNMLNSSE